MPTPPHKRLLEMYLRHLADDLLVTELSVRGYGEMGLRETQEISTDFETKKGQRLLPIMPQPSRNPDMSPNNSREFCLAPTGARRMVWGVPHVGVAALSCRRSSWRTF